MAQFLITNFDTHSPATWAETLLDDLVPTIGTLSATRQLKVIEAKNALRPHVIAMVTAVRESERDSYKSFNDDEKATFAATYRAYHGLEDPNGLHFHALHKETDKVRASNDWAEQYVDNICKEAAEIDGHVPVSEMHDVVYRILDHWVSAVQMCERSHFVTTNKLHL